LNLRAAASRIRSFCSWLPRARSLVWNRSENPRRCSTSSKKCLVSSSQVATLPCFCSNISVTVAKKCPPTEILIFDVDGVLVDVRGTYWRSALETVRYITGKRVTYAELHQWKSKPGFNDDWAMVSAWVSSLGHPTTYEEARSVFEKFYWGSNGKPGNVRNEKLVVTPKQIEKWARRFELNLFTGRTRQEFSFTFERWPATKHFRTIITMDDAKRKPHPEGLHRILGERDPASALYLGDNIDDALAARDARVPFMAIIAPGEHRYRQRAARFRELGALALLPRATDLNACLK
jgi:HAD superfamily phosphatase